MKNKKNYRLIPRLIQDKLLGIEESQVVVGTVREYRDSDIRRGNLQHLGVRLVDTNVVFDPEVIPPSQVADTQSVM